MAKIKSFKPLIYKDQKNLKNLISPPYDVINEDLAEKLTQRDPHNAIRVTYALNDKEQNKFSALQKVFQTWLSENILVPASENSIIYLEEEFEWKNVKRTRRGILALVDVNSDGKIIPHEKTFEPVVNELVQFLENTQAHLSPIFLVVEDSKNEFSELLKDASKGTDVQKIDNQDDPICHNIASLTNETTLERIQNFFVGKNLMIADGHHRYQASLNYMKKTGKNIPILAYITSSSDSGLILEPSNITIEKIIQTCKDGKTLPQKSTYFYPKVMSGIAFYQF